MNDTDVETLYQMNVDVWATSRKDGWVEAMVDSNTRKALESLYPSFRVAVPNVQEAIDQKEERKPGPYAFFDEFRTYAEVSAWLNEQLEAHPNEAKPVLIGRTYQGRDIRGVVLGSGTPIIYIHCTIHAREWITTSTCCWIIDSLLNTDPDGPSLLNDFTWIIVPIFNADGYEYSHNTQRLWRKNRQPNSGSSCIGTDLNRNYRLGFGGGGSSGDPCSDIYRGASAYSSPEVNAEQAYLSSIYGRLFSYVDIHSYGGQFMSPWGYTTQLPPDYNQMLTVMRSCTDAIYDVNGRSYDYGSSAVVIYIAAGGSDDDAYGTHDVIRSFTIEAWGSSFTPQPSTIPVVGSELYAGFKRLAQDAKEHLISK